MLTHAELAALQLAAYEYPNASGVVTPFPWDWQSTLQKACAPIAAGLRVVCKDQVIIMPGTGGDVTPAETRRQWEHNLAPWPDRLSHPLFGWVCARFYEEVEKFVLDIVPHIDATSPIYCIGHSRGAPQAAYVAGLLLSKGFTITELIQFAPPRAGGKQFAIYIESIPKTLYRNVGAAFPHADLVTDVPFDIPLVEPCCQVGRLFERTVVPLPDDTWGVFCYHHMQLYASGTFADLSVGSPIS
jgi:hypothetical protein